ncbi:MAG: hypothetical protein K2X04_00150 [Burkholderiales bacterium]|nr:hypothetical protein [Burkholderiales bacterium]
MKKPLGFSLVELMVALAMSAAIITVMMDSFSSLNGSFMFNTNQLELNQNLRMSLGLIKRDVQNAGVFGSFSFHDQSSAASYMETTSASNNCSTAEWCNFDLSTVGVRSASSFTELAANLDSGLTLVGGSDVLRLQYGSDKVAYVSTATIKSDCATAPGNNYLYDLSFTNQGLDLSASRYMLASTNHAYLLKLSSASTLVSPLTLACPGSPPTVAVESAIGGLSYDPDVSSMQLVNFYTRYYFVGTKSGVTGLYTKTLQANGSLSSAKLISNLVTRINFMYKVNTLSANVNSYPSTASRYRYLPTSAMESTPAYFGQLSAVTISISGSSTQAVDSNMAKLTQTQSDSVAWR